MAHRNDLYPLGVLRCHRWSYRGTESWGICELIPQRPWGISVLYPQRSHPHPQFTLLGLPGEGLIINVIEGRLYIS